MTTMSDLPEDLTKEIFSRVPLTSLSAVRSTCKRILGFAMKFDLQGIRNEADFVDPSITQRQVKALCVESLFGQMNWTQQTNNFRNVDKYALGYNKNRNHKILRIFGEHGTFGRYIVLGYEIFDLSSNTLKRRAARGITSKLLDWSSIGDLGHE
ncbi:hypothetical protein F2Q70_00037374 [Brassica cretica]|uniref:F-box domain-containing protein n=1 Tax=Brassica cretica TaxID=69181 RepID=A0A8S9JST1_BRACR|nr:hypothetical protein F2Q70_00037374 [Brassica cretica]